MQTDDVELTLGPSWSSMKVNLPRGSSSRMRGPGRSIFALLYGISVVQSLRPLNDIPENSKWTRSIDWEFDFGVERVGVSSARGKS